MLSETRTEELLRDVLAAQADRAPSAADVLAGLDNAGDARLRRSRRVGVLAAVVVLAVAIPVGLHLNGPSPAAVDPTATGGGPTMALAFHPTWTPPGCWRSAPRTSTRLRSTSTVPSPRRTTRSCTS